MAENALSPILAYKADEIAALRPQAADLRAKAADRPTPRSFLGAITADADRGGAFICEFKRKSPSGGDIRPGAAPAQIAEAYEAAGATALSILTDGPSFGGGLSDLQSAKAACRLPVLRKDFMIDPLQVIEARAYDADAILIILGAVSDGLAQDLEGQADALGLAVLAEAHNQDELDRAISLRTALIGINNRDLTRLETDLSTTEKLAEHVPDNRLLITESGVRTAEDVRRLKRAGARGYLVGEHLLRQSEIEKATSTLISAARQD